MIAALESIRSKARDKTRDSIVARGRGIRIALGDASDPRMLRAAADAVRLELACPILIGNSKQLEDEAANAAVSLEGMEIVSPASFSSVELLTSEYFHRRAGKVPSLEAATSELRSNELLFGAALVRAGYADGMVAGSLSTTATVLRAALRGIGLADGVSSLSSMFLLAFPAIPGFRELECTLAFADAAVLVEPTVEELADIAIETAATFRALTSIEPQVAMLSFSTQGSAKAPSTEKMIAATARAHEKAPSLAIDGEFQFDAAFVPEVAARKARDSSVAGRANVFVFPNLDAGNIGYKIAERLGMGEAIGPVLQGLAKPMNDLSRGASVSDIVNMIAVTVLQGSNA